MPLEDVEATLPTSFLRTDSHLIGAKISIFLISHTIAGFQRIASKIARPAEGEITSYETRSTFISGRVKQAFFPETSKQKPRIIVVSFIHIWFKRKNQVQQNLL